MHSASATAFLACAFIPVRAGLTVISEKIVLIKPLNSDQQHFKYALQKKKIYV